MTNHNDSIRKFLLLWRQRSWLGGLLMTTGTVIFSACLFAKFDVSEGWLVLPLLLSSGIYLFISRPWKVNMFEIARYLNEAVPGVQESAQLLLKPAHSLNPLEVIQAEKISGLLETANTPYAFNRPVVRSAKISMVLLCCAALLLVIPTRYFYPANKVIVKNISLAHQSANGEQHAILQDARVTVQPPSYTRRQQREQQSLNVKAEEGALITWKLKTSMPAAMVQLLLNDSDSMKFTPGMDSSSWSVSIRMNRPGFYQLQIDDIRTSLYTLEMIADNGPAIHVNKPGPYTKIDFGMPQKIDVSVFLGDDYGVETSALSATIASGSGEGVKFKEQHLPFKNFRPGGTNYTLNKLLDLKALGMQPGDELYFYVTATDSRSQESKSDVYIVSLPDTANLMSLEGLAMGVNLVPEYFRSQRQIIIETESLIRQKDSLATSVFHAKSNDLGNDQKLLRLRYGKFLGEESEEEIGGKEDQLHHGKESTPVAGDAKALLDPYTHQHDNAEDASFFDPKLKEQLKATLAEMWKAELQLRLYKPQEALPFEYKALVLLKDLQQQSRAYVAKTTFKAAPLDFKKRLSGDISQVVGPKLQATAKPEDETVAAIRMALSSMVPLSQNLPLDKNEIESIAISLRKLYSEAALNPARYLQGAAALKRVSDLLGLPALISKSDIDVAERALYELAGQPEPLPTSGRRVNGSLSSYYFDKLNREK